MIETATSDDDDDNDFNHPTLHTYCTSMYIYMFELSINKSVANESNNLEMFQGITALRISGREFEIMLHTIHNWNLNFLYNSKIAIATIRNSYIQLCRTIYIVIWTHINPNHHLISLLFRRNSFFPFSFPYTRHATTQHNKTQHDTTRVKWMPSSYLPQMNLTSGWYGHFLCKNIFYLLKFPTMSVDNSRFWFTRSLASRSPRI